MRGFTSCVQRELQLLGLLAPDPFETHGRSALPTVRPFAASPPLLRPLLTPRSVHGQPLRRTSPFRAWGEASPDKSPGLPLHDRRIYAAALWSRELRGHLPARPGRRRLISGFCSSARRFVPRFLQRRPRDRRLAVPLGPCDQVPGGLSPPGQCPCRAYRTRRAASERTPPHRREVVPRALTPCGRSPLAAPSDRGSRRTPATRPRQAS